MGKAKFLSNNDGRGQRLAKTMQKTIKETKNHNFHENSYWNSQDVIYEPPQFKISWKFIFLRFSFIISTKIIRIEDKKKKLDILWKNIKFSENRLRCLHKILGDTILSVSYYINLYLKFVSHKFTIFYLSSRISQQFSGEAFCNYFIKTTVSGWAKQEILGIHHEKYLRNAQQLFHRLRNRIIFETKNLISFLKQNYEYDNITDSFPRRFSGIPKWVQALWKIFYLWTFFCHNFFFSSFGKSLNLW